MGRVSLRSWADALAGLGWDRGAFGGASTRIEAHKRPLLAEHVHNAHLKWSDFRFPILKVTPSSSLGWKETKVAIFIINQEWTKIRSTPPFSQQLLILFLVDEVWNI